MEPSSVTGHRAERMLAVQAITEATQDFEPRAVFAALVTMLAVWTTENNMDPRRTVVVLAEAIASYEQAAHAEATAE